MGVFNISAIPRAVLAVLHAMFAVLLAMSAVPLQEEALGKDCEGLGRGGTIHPVAPLQSDKNYLFKPSREGLKKFMENS